MLVTSSSKEQVRQSNTQASSASKSEEKSAVYFDIEDVDSINDGNFIAGGFDESKDKQEISVFLNDDTSGISNTTSAIVLDEQGKECKDKIDFNLLEKVTDREISRNSVDIDNGTDDYFNQSEPDGKPMVSIYMIPLKDTDDIDEDMTTFSGRFSPWLLEEEELDSNQDDIVNDLQLLLEKNTNSPTIENCIDIVNGDITYGVNLDLDIENKTGLETISEDTEDVVTELETENTKVFSNDNMLENKLSQLSLEESLKVNEKKNPNERLLDNTSKGFDQSKRTKTKSHRRGKRSSSRKKRNKSRNLDERQLKEIECQKETKRVRFEEEDDDMLSRTIKHPESELSDEDMNQVEIV